MLYDWTVIGAGAGGVASIGKLLDSGIKPEKICWIDHDFQAGDLGKYWDKVSSNTAVNLFTKFFEAFKSFNYDQCESSLKNLDQKSTCELSHAAQTLKWVTNHLMLKVNTVKSKVNSIRSIKDCAWHINGKNLDINSKKIILAQGSEPQCLPYTANTIPLNIALNVEKLSQKNLKGKQVAVFGSSHSAIIIIRSLLEQGASVINFYRSPLVYAINMGDWILHDGTGLKGKTAEWAKENVHSNTSQDLQRVLSIESNIKEYLPKCDYVVYATGFSKRHIKIDDVIEPVYDCSNGIIASGIFGIGLAYPELVKDAYGHMEYHVGLYKFMNYIDRVFPLWDIYPQKS